MKKLLFTVLFLGFSVPPVAMATDIATCGASSGYAYDAFRGLNDEKDVGWKDDGIQNGKFTFKIDDEGNLDLLISGELGVSSSISDGARIIPATISEEAATIVLIYPNRLTETYAFQRLKNKKAQVMWTQVKAETPIPRITAFTADCSFLNLSPLTK